MPRPIQVATQSEALLAELHTEVVAAPGPAAALDLCIERAVLGVFFTGVKLTNGMGGLCATPIKSVPEAVCCPSSAMAMPVPGKIGGRNAVQLLQNLYRPQDLRRARVQHRVLGQPGVAGDGLLQSASCSATACQDVTPVSKRRASVRRPAARPTAVCITRSRRRRLCSPTADQARNSLQMGSASRLWTLASRRSTPNATTAAHHATQPKAAAAERSRGQAA